MEKETFANFENIINNPNWSNEKKLELLKSLVHTIDDQEAIVEPVDLNFLIEEDFNLLSFKNKDNLILTGYSSFDAEFGGFTPGELVIIGGRPGMGKTLLMVDLATNISMHHKLLYVTLELSARLLSYRFIASASGVPSNNLANNKISEFEVDEIKEAANIFKTRNIIIDDTPAYDINKLKKQCERLIKENDIKVIFIDYLQLINSFKHKNYRFQEISHITKVLKSIAKEFNVCIVVASQLSRAVETRTGHKKPILSDLRESGSIEQEADKVIFIYRPEYYKFDTTEEGLPSERMVNLIIAKNRNGLLGETYLIRDEHFTSLADYGKRISKLDFYVNRLNELGEAPF